MGCVKKEHVSVHQDLLEQTVTLVGCLVGFWGPNCTSVCKCNNGVCDPIDGSCSIKNKIEDGYTDSKTYEQSSEFASNYFSETTFIAETTETFLSGNDNKVTEWYYDKESTTRKVDPAYYDSNLYFTSTEPTKMNVIEPTIKSNNNSNIHVNLYVKNLTMSVNKTKSSSKENKSLKSNVINNDVELIIPVGIHYDRISKHLLHEDTTPITNQERTYLSEEITNKNEKKRFEEYYFINSMSVSAVTAVALIFLALAAFTVRKKFKSKQEAESIKSDGVATVAVYTASIFHTPLPDPPACENPSYILSMECQNNLHEPISHTRAVFNPSKNISSDFKPYEYDYPPSSGGYRVASIIDPLDADVNQKPIFTQTEPVYDEIPCRGDYEYIAESHVEDTTSVYMNTCGLAKV